VKRILESRAPLGLLVLLVASCFFVERAAAQQPAKVILIKANSAKVKVIPLGKRIIVRSNDALTERKGQLQGVTDSSMIVGGEEILFSELTQIRWIDYKKAVAITIGTGIITVGTVWAFIGYLFLIDGIATLSWVKIVGGALDAFIGRTIMASGIHWITTKKYELNGKWQIKAL